MGFLARGARVSALVFLAATSMLAACAEDRDSQPPTSPPQTATAPATGTPRAATSPPTSSPKAGITATPASGTGLARVSLDPAGGGQARGTATVTSTPGGVAIALQAHGLQPAANYTLLFRAGTCAAASASTGRLGTFRADASGAGALTATAAEAAAGSAAPLTLELLRDGPHVLELRGADGTLVACGELPPLPTSSGGGAGPGY